jgi:hypothetical protein
MSYRPTPAEIAECIDDIKREILNDMGVIMPLTVKTFSELHDYVDANCYGGLCDDERRARWFTDNLDADLLNRVQDAVDAWLRSGQARRERLLQPARKENTNCLEGVRCPQCGHEEGLSVSVTALARLSDNGFIDHEDMDFQEASRASCPECSHTGVAEDFRIAKQQHDSMPQPPAYMTLGDLRHATAHLPDEVPLTGAPPHEWAEWVNLSIDLSDVPQTWPHPEMSSIILGVHNTFDSRQW